MNKIKVILVCLIIPFLVLISVTFWQIKKKEEFQQKVVLAVEIRKVLNHLMLDLREAQIDTIQDVPADGMWHNRIAFIKAGQGPLEYLIKGTQLLRTINGQAIVIADDIVDLHIRRQSQTPDILEVQIKAQKNVSLIFNLKVRIRQ